MELQKTENKTSLQIQISELAGAMYKINFAMGYPLSEKQTEDWAKCIASLRPETTKEELNSVIRSIIIGETEFEASRGIRDVFTALEKSSIKKPWSNDPEQYLR